MIQNCTTNGEIQRLISCFIQNGHPAFHYEIFNVDKILYKGFDIPFLKTINRILRKKMKQRQSRQDYCIEKMKYW